MAKSQKNTKTVTSAQENFFLSKQCPKIFWKNLFFYRWKKCIYSLLMEWFQTIWNIIGHFVERYVKISKKNSRKLTFFEKTGKFGGGAKIFDIFRKNAFFCNLWPDFRLFEAFFDKYGGNMLKLGKFKNLKI